MPNSSKTRDRSSPYNPQSDRASDLASDRVPVWWRRPISFGEITAALALLGTLLTSMGWHYLPASRAVDIESLARATADTALRRDVERNTHRLDSLANRLEFTNYLQCVQLRKTDPASLPRDCAPIIERGTRP